MSRAELILAVAVTSGLLAGSLRTLLGCDAEKIYDGKAGRKGWSSKVMSRDAWITQSKVIAWAAIVFVVLFWTLMFSTTDESGKAGQAMKPTKTPDGRLEVSGASCCMQ